MESCFEKKQRDPSWTEGPSQQSLGAVFQVMRSPEPSEEAGSKTRLLSPSGNNQPS